MKEKEGSDSHGDDFGPFILDRHDGVEFRDMDRSAIVNALMRSEEVIVGDEEHEFSDGA